MDGFPLSNMSSSSSLVVTLPARIKQINKEFKIVWQFYLIHKFWHSCFGPCVFAPTHESNMPSFDVIMELRKNPSEYILFLLPHLCLLQLSVDSCQRVA